MEEMIWIKWKINEREKQWNIQIKKKYLCKGKNGNEIIPNQNINSDYLWVIGL